MKTYKVTKREDAEFVVETSIVENDRTYHKKWLIDEIARLTDILSKFEK